MFDANQAAALLGKCQFIFVSLGTNLYPLIRPLSIIANGGRISDCSLIMCFNTIKIILRSLPAREVLYEVRSWGLNVLVYTDASFATNKRYGYVGGVLVFKGTYRYFSMKINKSDFMVPYGDHPICFMEVLAVPLAIKMWGIYLRNLFVYFLIDNSSAGHCLVRKCSRSYGMAIGGLVVSQLALEYNISYWSSRVTSHTNIADCTTREEMLIRLQYFMSLVKDPVDQFTQFWFLEHLGMRSPEARSLGQLYDISYFQDGGKDPILVGYELSSAAWRDEIERL